jgi:ATP-dependent DNA ligase
LLLGFANRLRWPIYGPCLSSAYSPDPLQFPPTRIGFKHDGHRLMFARSGNRVRLITQGGYDWTKRFPWIVDAALKNRHKAFRDRRRSGHPWR